MNWGDTRRLSGRAAPNPAAEEPVARRAKPAAEEPGTHRTARAEPPAEKPEPWQEPKPRGAEAPGPEAETSGELAPESRGLREGRPHRE